MSMDKKSIVNKINGYITELQLRLGNWLSIELPKTGEDWWEERVYANLDEERKKIADESEEKAITLFDLPTLLHLLYRNWYVLAKKNDMPSILRSYAQQMKNVRNDWAHISFDKVTKDLVKKDMPVVIQIYKILGSTDDEVNSMYDFLDDVLDDVLIANVTPNEWEQATAKKSSQQGFEKGDMVALKSDPTKIGLVHSISGNKVTIFAEGVLSSYYIEQVQHADIKDENHLVTLDRCRASLTAHQINNPNSRYLYSLNSARIDFIPYQFRPALKIIRSPVHRILIADDVGVGKTIETGLIIKELEARGEVSSVLILCPKALIVEHKWLYEMKRFDEDFEELDGERFRNAIGSALKDEWPSKYSHVIVPYSLLTEETVDGSNKQGKKKPSLKDLIDKHSMPRFDLVIVDEAHNIRNQATWAYKGVSKFVNNAEAVVLLTATPIQNNSDDLFTLLNLIRPDVVFDKKIFETMSKPNPHINNIRREVTAQKEGWRERSEENIDKILGTTWGYRVTQNNPEFEKVYGFLEKESPTLEEKINVISSVEKLHSFDSMISRTRRCDIDTFCIRRVEAVRNKFNDSQKKLYDALIEFEALWKTKLYGERNARMMMCMIMRQAASCIYGLAPFLNDMIGRRIEQIEYDGEWYESDVVLDDSFLDQLKKLAENIRLLVLGLSPEDPKLEYLLDIIKRKQNEQNRRVIVFSSFRNTLGYIRTKLEERGYRVGQIDGSVKDAERFELRQRFASDSDNQSAVDILLFSEVGCEGLDYQFCDTMVNYDLPWNPMRVEQRIGRIDRRGQKSEHVQIWNMVTDDTIDAVIYDRCLSKIGVFEQSIGDCSEILGKLDQTIREIMFDPQLTEEERSYKLGKEADNQTSRIIEMRRLEKDSKSLYGFDLSENSLNNEVLDSENQWISPIMVQGLVKRYLNDVFGEDILKMETSQPQMLNLSKEKRSQLLDNLENSNIQRNTKQYRDWSRYLNSDRSMVKLVFDIDAARDNPKALFITHLHPLALQAAKYEATEFPCDVGIRVSDSSSKPGNYAFEIYVWKYSGDKDDVRLVAVCKDKEIQDKLVTYMREGSEYTLDVASYKEEWESLEETHYRMWQDAKSEHVESVSRDCDYRIEQSNSMTSQRIAIIEEMMTKVVDDNVLRMRTSQIQNIQADNEKRKRSEDQKKKKADIHAELLLKGVLHVDKERFE